MGIKDRTQSHYQNAAFLHLPKPAANKQNVLCKERVLGLKGFQFMISVAGTLSAFSKPGSSEGGSWPTATLSRPGGKRGEEAGAPPGVPPPSMGVQANAKWPRLLLF